MLKNYLLIILCFLSINKTFAQEETSKRTNRLTDSVKEIYQALKSNKYVKHGLYTAMFRDTTPVATGLYDHDNKVGLWRFFDPSGRLLQTYDYNKKKLMYEAPELQGSDLHYFADIDIDSADVITKPIKIGGRYFGFIPYLQLFKLPNDIWNIDRYKYTAQVELLISPMGRLAYYWVRITGVDGYERLIRMNLNLPNPDDNVFTPCTKNGQPISCRIIIAAFITDGGHLDFR